MLTIGSKYSCCRRRGFSLLEVSIVLLVIGLTISGLLLALRDQLKQKSYDRTQYTLDFAAEQLLSWAMTRPDAPHLPCPDNSGDGEAEERVEDTNIPGRFICPFQEGWLPWRTLGVRGVDAWGRPIRYRVDSAFSQLERTDHEQWNGIRLNQAAKDKVRVCDEAECRSVLAKDLAFVLLSHGANGIVIPYSNSTEYPAIVNYGADEWHNLYGRVRVGAGSNKNDFVARMPAWGANTVTEFDDLVVWIPVSRIIGQLVVAGRLP